MSTIAVDRNKRNLVIHKTGGGGGPFSRMTKVSRLDFKRSPQSLRRKMESISYGSTNMDYHLDPIFKEINSIEQRRIT